MAFSKPIEDINDPRFWGMVAIATDPMPDEVAQWGAWVKAYLARGQILPLIERARLEMPPPIEIWRAMGERTFDGRSAQSACMSIAAACGWTPRQMAGYTGLREFEGYAAVALCTLVGIRSSRNAEPFAWRTFHRKLERLEEEHG